MKMFVTLFVVFAVASSALGECPVPPNVPGADIGKIAGRWYRIGGKSIITGNPRTDLYITDDFIPLEDGNFNYTITEAYSEDIKFSVYNLAERTDSQNSLNVYDIERKVPYHMTYYIIDTDYDNYLAAYACLETPISTSPVTSFILSRTNSMSAAKYDELSNLLVNIFKKYSPDFDPED
ncbi:apolipoprotein D-like [Tetranychus urticae]|uniref:Lipocalin/cytosolic fatty-acid binding domain-containing protein n=1 Tax=Tetranychus urticae TaxID=32264 RepID=T1K726_TETUR|nr:apolipoprotein D-like [Tetranychus urticae]